MKKRTGLSIASQVRIPDDVIFNELQGEMVLLNLKTGIYFGLDPVGTRAWQLLRGDGRLGVVRDAMLKEYEVSADRIWKDLHDLITRLTEKGLVEVIDEGTME